MPAPLVPVEILRKSNKILFIAHLALGDFTYLQNCFRRFAETYPHIEVHLWVDEVRRTADVAQWPHLKKYALYDWLAGCSFFRKVYTETYSPELFEKSIRDAQQEHYPLVISLATLRPHQYAQLARRISPDGYVTGMREPAGLLGLLRRTAYQRLDVTLDIYSLERGDARHISDIYAGWFRDLFGMEIPAQDRFPFVDIPEQWRLDAQHTLEQWGFARRSGRLVFINPYAKTKKRCWPLERVAQLIAAMSVREEWRGACFIVNATPQEMAAARQALERQDLPQTRLFSAEDNFFQLPAMLEKCDLVISVETAVMHLANAVHVPVIALMRQKNPEWVPIDRANSIVLTAARRSDWVNAIPVEQVMAALPAAPESRGG
jgi:ADP-heptose:LPS heptosyltransferase